MNILKFLIILFSLAKKKSRSRPQKSTPAPAPAKKLRLRPALPHCINQYWKLEQRNRIILLRICSFSAEPEPNLHTGYANTGCVLLLFPASHLCLMVGYRQAREDSTPVNSFSCTQPHTIISSTLRQQLLQRTNPELLY